MRKRMATLILLAVASMACAAQQAVAPSPSSDYCVGKSELRSLQARGRAGNIAAAKKVGYHFMICEAQEEAGLAWFERAGDAGDLQSREFVVGLLSKWAKNDEATARHLVVLKNRWNM